MQRSRPSRQRQGDSLPGDHDPLRDGPQVQVPVDTCIRSLLIGHALPWALVAGQGEARVESALDAVAPLLRQRLQAAPGAAGTNAAGSGLFSRLAARDADQPAWRWTWRGAERRRRTGPQLPISSPSSWARLGSFHTAGFSSAALTSFNRRALRS